MKIGISFINYTGDKQEFRDRFSLSIRTLLESDITNYDFTLALFENGSSETGIKLSYETYSAIKAQLQPNHKILWDLCRSPLGIVFSRNHAMYMLLADSKEYDYILEVHNDMVFPKIWFKPLIDFMEEHKEYAVISPNIITSQRKSIFDVKESDFNIKTIGPTEIIANHPDIIRFEYLKQVGTFYNKMFFNQNFDEIELWFKFIKKGYKVGICPTSVVYHEKAATRLDLLFNNDGRINFGIASRMNKGFEEWFNEFRKEEERLRELTER